MNTNMNMLSDIYRMNPGFWHTIILLLVFGGMARIAFWRDPDGMRVGGPLAVGLGLLLTIALLTWADEHRRRITELGPWAALILIQAILLLAFNARRKAKNL